MSPPAVVPSSKDYSPLIDEAVQQHSSTIMTERPQVRAETEHRKQTATLPASEAATTVKQRTTTSYIDLTITQPA
ncbi:MAG: hypothetical protein Q9180_009395, partial [Flavoplaca navasiana]